MCVYIYIYMKSYIGISQYLFLNIRTRISTIRASLVAQMVKNPPCNAGDLGSIPGLGRCPGGGHGNSLQCFCLDKPQGQRSLAGYGPWGRKESDMMATKRSTAQEG